MFRIALGLLGLSLSVSAATISFTCLDNNSGTCPANVAPYITASFSDLGGGQVQVLFANTLPTAGRIREAFIDEGSNDFFSGFSITATPGTSFVLAPPGRFLEQTEIPTSSRRTTSPREPEAPETESIQARP